MSQTIESVMLSWKQKLLPNNKYFGINMLNVIAHGSVIAIVCIMLFLPPRIQWIPLMIYLLFIAIWYVLRESPIRKLLETTTKSDLPEFPITWHTITGLTTILIFITLFFIICKDFSFYSMILHGGNFIDKYLQN